MTSPDDMPVSVLAHAVRALLQYGLPDGNRGTRAAARLLVFYWPDTKWVGRVNYLKHLKRGTKIGDSPKETARNLGLRPVLLEYLAALGVVGYDVVPPTGVSAAEVEVIDRLRAIDDSTDDAVIDSVYREAARVLWAAQKQRP